MSFPGEPYKESSYKINQNSVGVDSIRQNLIKTCPVIRQEYENHGYSFTFGNGLFLEEKPSGKGRMYNDNGAFHFASRWLTAPSHTAENLYYDTYGLHFTPTLRDGSFAQNPSDVPEEEKDEVKLSLSVGLLALINFLKRGEGNYKSNEYLLVRTNGGFSNYLKLKFKFKATERPDWAVIEVSGLLHQEKSIENYCNDLIQRSR